MVLELFTSAWGLNPCPGTQTQTKPCLGLEPTWLRLKASYNPQYLVSGPNEAQVFGVSSQKEFWQVIGKKWIYSDSERSTDGPQAFTEGKCDHEMWLVFIGWVISYANEWEDLRRSGDFQDLGHCPLLRLLTVPWNCPGTSGCVIALAD